MKEFPVRFRDATLTVGNSGLNATEQKHTGFYLYYNGDTISRSALDAIGEFLSAKAKEYSV